MGTGFKPQIPLKEAEFKPDRGGRHSPSSRCHSAETWVHSNSYVSCLQADLRSRPLKLDYVQYEAQLPEFQTPTSGSCQPA
jgi:hypothetical protein